MKERPLLVIWGNSVLGARDQPGQISEVMLHLVWQRGGQWARVEVVWTVEDRISRGKTACFFEWKPQDLLIDQFGSKGRRTVKDAPSL